MKTRNLIAAMAITALLSVTLSAQEENRDDIIYADVFNVVQSHVFYTIFDIVSVDVSEGVVTLGGFVTDPYKSDAFERTILHRVDGVASVENNIETLSVSAVDDNLRYAIARGIYTDDRLLRYSIMRNQAGPIHIIVNNGYVTLEGVVATRMDSRLVESIARGVGGIVNLTNNLRVEE